LISKALVRLVYEISHTSENLVIVEITAIVRLTDGKR
jgi:hypothetical protein